MSAVGVVRRIFAVADVRGLWAEAGDYGEGKRQKKKNRKNGRGKLIGQRQVGAEEGPPCGWAAQTFSIETLTGKQRGELAEAAFMVKASELGFGVAKPWGDSDRYDFILDVEGELWRVQVKSAHRAGQDGCYSFRLHTHSLQAYTAAEIDVLVAYVVPEDEWYVFPVRELGRLRSLKLFPGSRRKQSKFEKWREAWWVFGERHY